MRAEREIMLTGIGGQGVQLAAQVLARSALVEGREVMMLGTYGGAMRGGNTDSTLVVANAPISAPPIVSRTWSAIAMHHEFWPAVASKLRPDAVVVLNSSLFEGEVEGPELRVFGVDATVISSEVTGAPMAASLVLASAYARVTGMVKLESLVAAMKESVPSYRQQHLAANEAALRAGWDLLSSGAAPFWNGAR